MSPDGNPTSVSARSVVLALAAVDVLAFVLAAFGVGGSIPSRSYVVFDVVTELILLVGLWFFWRAAWWLAIVAAVLGEVFETARSAEDLSAQRAVLLALGLVYLALLMAPSLRHAIRPMKHAQPM
jgi:hypothetical protein